MKNIVTAASVIKATMNLVFFNHEMVLDLSFRLWLCNYKLILVTY